MVEIYAEADFMLRNKLEHGIFLLIKRDGVYRWKLILQKFSNAWWSYDGHTPDNINTIKLKRVIPYEPDIYGWEFKEEDIGSVCEG